MSPNIFFFISSIHDFPKNHIQFCVTGSESDNFIFLEIRNTKYSCRRKDITIRLLVVSLLYLCYLALAAEGILLFHTFFLITLGLFMYQLLSLVDKETLKVAKNFGVEKTVVSSFGRSNSLFVPYENIHRIVITEVIYFVSTVDTDVTSLVDLSPFTQIESDHFCITPPEIQRKSIDHSFI